MDDKRIIEMFFQRKESAVKEISVKYGRLCRKIAFEILRNEQDTEECISTAYVSYGTTFHRKIPNHLKAIYAPLCVILLLIHTIPLTVNSRSAKPKHRGTKDKL